MKLDTRLCLSALLSSFLICCVSGGEGPAHSDNKEVEMHNRYAATVAGTKANQETSPPPEVPEPEVAADASNGTTLLNSTVPKAVSGSVIHHGLGRGGAGLRAVHGMGTSKGSAVLGGKRRPRKMRSIGARSRPAHAFQEHNTEEYSGLKDAEFKSASSDPLSTFSIDVDTAAYANVRRFIEKQNRLPPVDAVRIEELINYFSYDYPAAVGQAPFSKVTEVSIAPWNPAHRLVHIGIQGKKIDMKDMPASNLVFLLDVSGSMRAANKLPLLKKSLGLLVENMRPQDTVSIVVYAGAAGLVLPPTPGNDRQTIMDALQRLNAGGSTAGAAGIQLAYQTARENFVKGGNNRVILATDGDFNVGTSSTGSLEDLIENERQSGVFLTILGFGMGNYKDGRMESLSNKGNGNAAYIDSLSEARKVLVEEMGGTLHTIAKDVKIQVEFNPARVKGYRLIGYVNRALANRDFNDDKKDAGELGAGHSVTALYEIIPVGSPEPIGGVDKLKYQTVETVSDSKELLTVKLRYKRPQGSKSQLMSTAVMDQTTDLAQTSDDFRFAAAVAQFGLILRKSKHKGQSTFDAVFASAKSALGEDPRGHRSAFLRLVRQAQDISGSGQLTQKVAQ